MSFDLDRFIADLRDALGERSRQAVREVVARAVAEPAALVKRLGTPEKAAVQVLHDAPDLTVLNVVWAPKQVTFPHDHRMGAVIGMYGGREDNVYWRRVADRRSLVGSNSQRGTGAHFRGESSRAKFEIEPAGGEAVGDGDTIILGRDIIHSVINPLDKISGAIHVYDGPFLTMARSMWNAETLCEAPYDVSVAVKGMPLQMAQ
ncbi:MAG: hypothetical protein ACREFI_06360 [Stellaceae bacterium]